MSDINGRAAQNWIQLPTPLGSAAASQSLNSIKSYNDPKLTALLHSINQIVSGYSKDIHGNAGSDKYRYIVDLILTRIKLYLSGEFSSSQISSIKQIITEQISSQLNSSLNSELKNMIKSSISDFFIKYQTKDDIEALKKFIENNQKKFEQETKAYQSQAQSKTSSSSQIQVIDNSKDYQNVLLHINDLITKVISKINFNTNQIIDAVQTPLSRIKNFSTIRSSVNRSFVKQEQKQYNFIYDSINSINSTLGTLLDSTNNMSLRTDGMLNDMQDKIDKMSSKVNILLLEVTGTITAFTVGATFAYLKYIKPNIKTITSLLSSAQSLLSSFNGKDFSFDLGSVLDTKKIVDAALDNSFIQGKISQITDPMTEKILKETDNALSSISQSITKEITKALSTFSFKDLFNSSGNIYGIMNILTDEQKKKSFLDGMNQTFLKFKEFITDKDLVNFIEGKEFQLLLSSYNSFDTKKLKDIVYSFNSVDTKKLSSAVDIFNNIEMTQVEKIVDAYNKIDFGKLLSAYEKFDDAKFDRVICSFNKIDVDKIVKSFNNINTSTLSSVIDAYKKIDFNKVKESINSLDTKKVDSLVSSFNKLNFDKITSNIEKIEVSKINGLVSAYNKIDKSDVQKLVSAFNSINTSTLDRVVSAYNKIDISKLSDALSKVDSKNIDNLVSSVNSLNIGKIVDGIKQLDVSKVNSLVSAYNKIDKSDVQKLVSAFNSINTSTLDRVVSAYNKIDKSDVQKLVSAFNSINPNLLDRAVSAYNKIDVNKLSKAFNSLDTSKVDNLVSAYNKIDVNKLSKAFNSLDTSKVDNLVSAYNKIDLNKFSDAFNKIENEKMKILTNLIPKMKELVESLDKLISNPKFSTIKEVFNKVIDFSKTAIKTATIVSNTATGVKTLSNKVSNKVKGFVNKFKSNDSPNAAYTDNKISDTPKNVSMQQINNMPQPNNPIQFSLDDIQKKVYGDGSELKKDLLYIKKSLDKAVNNSEENKKSLEELKNTPQPVTNNTIVGVNGQPKQNKARQAEEN